VRDPLPIEAPIAPEKILDSNLVSEVKRELELKRGSK
jgi:hypothetical protein